MIEARLQATDNWPQPPWVITALTQDIEAEVKELVNRKIDADSVRKIYRRKSEPALRQPRAATVPENSRPHLTAA